MKHHKTLVELLEAISIEDRSITFIEGAQKETQIAYPELYRRALNALFVFQSLGVKPGDEVVLFLRDNEKFIEAFWACLLGGMVPVPVAVGISDEHRAKVFKIFQRLKRPYLYTDSESMVLLEVFAAINGMRESFTKIKATLIETIRLTVNSEIGRIKAARPDDIGFIQFSSGSTREPKGVVLTHRNLLSTNYAMGNRLRYTQDDISLSWMPLTHDLGIIGFHLNMLVFGMSQNLMPTDLFSRRPLLWLQKAHEKRATILCSPNFGYKHYLKVYETRDTHELDLSCVRVIINGAEPISVDLCKRFVKTMRKHGLAKNTLYPGYGLAEAGLAVALPEPEQGFEYFCVNRHELKLGSPVKALAHDHPDAISFAIEGSVVEDCQLQIGNEQGIDLGLNVIGEIQIKGENVTKGYYADDNSNQGLFTSNGWLCTGDLGFLNAGKLVVTGRLKDIIFVNGVNYYPHDLEAIALQHEELELGKVVVAGTRRDKADQDDILIFVLFRGDQQTFAILAKQLAALIAEKAGLQTTHIIPVSRIPKTTSGKVQRRFLVDEYLRGDYDAALEKLKTVWAISASLDMSRNSTETLLRDLCNEIFENKNITPNDSLFEIGASSLDLALIHEKIDVLYPGVLDVTDFFEYPTLRLLAAYLEFQSQAHQEHEITQ